jgi:hypothetical protein
MAVQMTIVLQNGPATWGEKYVAIGATDFGPSTIALAQALGNTRAQLMGEQCSVLGVRMQLIGTSRAVQWVYPYNPTNGVSSAQFDGQAPKDQDFNAPDDYADIFNTAMIVSFTAGLGFNRKVYMGGMPDGIQVGPQGVSIINAPHWFKYWKAWVKFILSGAWGYLGRVPQTNLQKYAITGYEIIAGNILELTVPSAASLNPALPVQVRRMKSSPTSNWFNRIYKVQAITGTSIFLNPAVPSFGTTTYLTGGTIEQVVFAPYGFTSVQIEDVRSRKRGNRSFFEPRGKSSKVGIRQR